MEETKCQQSFDWTMGHLADQRVRNALPPYTKAEVELLMVGFYQGWHQNHLLGERDASTGPSSVRDSSASGSDDRDQGRADPVRDHPASVVPEMPVPSQEDSWDGF